MEKSRLSQSRTRVKYSIHYCAFHAMHYKDACPYCDDLQQKLQKAVDEIEEYKQRSKQNAE